MASFSERHGYKKPHIQETHEGLSSEVRTRIWNLVFRIYGGNDGASYYMLAHIWDKFLKEDVSQFSSGYGTPELCKWIGSKLSGLDWHEIYDFVEFIWEDDSGHRLIWDQGISKILEEERVPCRFLNGRIVPITNPEEIVEIQKAVAAGDQFGPAREHLEKAFSILADRKKKDFANSIKESISALESLAKILLKDKNGTLGDLTKGLNIHPAFREGLSKLYGWTCKDGGIRHGKVDGNLAPSLADARFMLVLASAYFNYLIATYAPAAEKNI